MSNQNDSDNRLLAGWVVWGIGMAVATLPGALASAIFIALMLIAMAIWLSA